MKEKFYRLLSLWDLLIDRFNKYFLGPQSLDFQGPCVSSVSSVVFVDETNREEKMVLGNDWGSQGVVAVVSGMPHEWIGLDCKHSDVIAIFPQSVEKTLAMIDEVARASAHPMLLVLLHLTALMSESVNERTHEKIISRLMIEVKKMQAKQKFQLLLVDQEAWLGKKNSALVRRLFQEHNITNKK